MIFILNDSKHVKNNKSMIDAFLEKNQFDTPKGVISMIHGKTMLKMIVVPSAIESTDVLYEKIKIGLVNNQFEGSVIIDLLLQNGFASNRFITMEFVNGEFDYKTAKVYDADRYTKDSCDNFYMSNLELISSSALTRLERQRILKHYRSLIAAEQ